MANKLPQSPMASSDRGTPGGARPDVGSVGGARLVGQRIRARRRELGLRLVDVAEAVGISASAVSQMERGVVQPSMRSLVRIAEALDTLPHYLMDNTWASQPHPEAKEAGAAPSSKCPNAIVTRASEHELREGGPQEGAWRIMTEANPTFAAYEFHNGPDVPGEFYALPVDHLNIVVEGSYVLEIQGEGEETLNVGDTSYVRSGVYFRWIRAEETSRFISVLCGPAPEYAAGSSASEPWRTAPIRVYRQTAP
ncbi:helix-turn-helix domain-containing protein [Streptomyces fuscichromogenes]|uniref:HTH cro/C1-type domain-containing protein n=1 Tax=Streptomyces fuscichromogenes TaxID=1324013 RepID=A0A917XNI9_9ACTN|nr:helix-turn-helix transcriptional regulator [Streptomyces fuscichromogenes]GGN40289.1 hypothetical protein GCM10011578_087620 [Streptomyces fuscichromogenes]